MLLYVHVPFCHSKCHYCAFYSEVIDITTRYARQKILLYLNRLHQEISYWGDKLHSPLITTIFLGGGTPSLLLPEDVHSLLSHISSCLILSPNAEVTLEANPESLKTVSLAKEYLTAGINRFSLGFQSTNNIRLHSIGRIHTSDEAVQAYLKLREANCININIDLIWGLPQQTLFEWLTTLQEVITLNPDHISIYGLTLEPKTLFNKRYAQKNFLLPSDEQQTTMFFKAIERLTQAGFTQYEISNFARPNYQCKHNIGYWEGIDYLGIGPSATSTIDKKRWTNPANFSLWCSLIQKKKEPQKEYLDKKTYLKEYIMLRLRTKKGLSLQEYKILKGTPITEDYHLFISELQKNKFAYIQKGYLILTPAGMILSNSILERFFEKL